MKIFAFLIIVNLISVTARSQNDTIYFGTNGKICDPKDSEIKKIKNDISDSEITVETFSKKDGKWISFASEKIKIQDENEFKIQIKSPGFSGTVIRTFQYLDENHLKFTDYLKRKMIRTGITATKVPLILDGEVTEFYKNGNTKSISVYQNNELQSNKNWLTDGKSYFDNVFYSVDQEPLYKPGVSILHAYIRNALTSSEVDINQVNGRIVIGFVVLEDGSIDGIQIEEGLNANLNKIACNAFCTLPGSWQPAVLEGKDVRYYQLFPINFIYKEREFDFIELKSGIYNFGN